MYSVGVARLVVDTEADGGREEQMQGWTEGRQRDRWADSQSKTDSQPDRKKQNE